LHHDIGNHDLAEIYENHNELHCMIVSYTIYA